jgi:hypothetical protein
MNAVLQPVFEPAKDLKQILGDRGNSITNNIFIELKKNFPNGEKPFDRHNSRDRVFEFIDNHSKNAALLARLAKSLFAKYAKAVDNEKEELFKGLKSALTALVALSATDYQFPSGGKNPYKEQLRNVFESVLNEEGKRTPSCRHALNKFITSFTAEAKEKELAILFEIISPYRGADIAIGKELLNSFVKGLTGHEKLGRIHDGLRFDMPEAVRFGPVEPHLEVLYHALRIDYAKPVKKPQAATEDKVDVETRLCILAILLNSGSKETARFIREEREKGGESHLPDDLITLLATPATTKGAPSIKPKGLEALHREVCPGRGEVKDDLLFTVAALKNGSLAQVAENLSSMAQATEDGYEAKKLRDIAMVYFNGLKKMLEGSDKERMGGIPKKFAEAAAAAFYAIDIRDQTANILKENLAPFISDATLRRALAERVTLVDHARRGYNILAKIEEVSKKRKLPGLDFYEEVLFLTRGVSDQSNEPAVIDLFERVKRAGQVKADDAPNHLDAALALFNGAETPQAVEIGIQYLAWLAAQGVDRQGIYKAFERILVGDKSHLGGILSNIPQIIRSPNTRELKSSNDFIEFFKGDAESRDRILIAVAKAVLSNYDGFRGEEDPSASPALAREAMRMLKDRKNAGAPGIVRYLAEEALEKVGPWMRLRVSLPDWVFRAVNFVRESNPK